ncbi:MAG TPA: hydrogenase [Candidatus Binatia bacterium]|nr:hydrogenase [Candidatus Binatia bacterium]
MTRVLRLRNAEGAAQAALPVLSVAEFRDAVLRAVAAGARVAALFGEPSDAGEVRLVAVLAHGEEASLALVATRAAGRWPALTPECPQVHAFEREVAEQCGLALVGHPWPKPLRAPEATGFFRIDGEEVHEVAVGPVHAGVIEPGHFRFQCHGEEVLHLEIALGYQHRGVERALVGGPDKRSVHHAETLAGDTSIGHAIAYCQTIEALAGCRVPPRAEALRAVALELERLANHTGDLGALAGDVGYLPTAAFCGRLRGEFLGMTALVCGSRFGRGLVRPGGVGFDVEDARIGTLLERLDAAEREVRDAVGLLWEEPSVQSRFEDTGRLDRATSEALGVVGLAARACGLERDVRSEFPSGLYRFAHIPVATWHTGDVFARAYLRWLEIERSVEFVREQLRTLPPGPTRAPRAPLAPDGVAVALVEGWRGEICHVALTDGCGRFARYKVVDPSFHNWMGLAMALRGQEISDFPLCNKSFNLSYCGHDL